jgi:fructoselysine-6-P-deglycase FrlB-like protein
MPFISKTEKMFLNILKLEEFKPNKRSKRISISSTTPISFIGLGSSLHVAKMCAFLFSKAYSNSIEVLSTWDALTKLKPSKKESRIIFIFSYRGTSGLTQKLLEQLKLSKNFKIYLFCGKNGIASTNKNCTTFKNSSIETSQAHTVSLWGNFLNFLTLTELFSTKDLLSLQDRLSKIDQLLPKNQMITQKFFATLKKKKKTFWILHSLETESIADELQLKLQETCYLSNVQVINIEDFTHGPWIAAQKEDFFLFLTVEKQDLQKALFIEKALSPLKPHTYFAPQTSLFSGLYFIQWLFIQAFKAFKTAPDLNRSENATYKKVKNSLSLWY